MHEAETPKRAKHYKELIIWQRAMQLVGSVYRLTKAFPPDERYGLASQMRRAAVSIPSNIAEGQARRGTQEFVYFLGLASGSAAELETQVLLAIDLGYIQRADAAKAVGELAEVERMAATIQKKLAVQRSSE